MSLTTAEEEKVRAIITAFDNGKTIDQLPLADTNQPSKYLIEGVSKETGESVRIPFADAVSIVNKHVAIRRWKRGQGTPVGESYGNIDFLRDLPSVIGLGCYLVSVAGVSLTRRTTIVSPTAVPPPWTARWAITCGAGTPTTTLGG